jgi:predicted acylesterase/phospholipase RssA
VLDCLLEDGRLVVEGVSATSAGAMNAAVLAHGLLQGDREGARQALHDFWHEVAQTSALYGPFSPLPWENALASEILNRIDEVSFNSSLMREMRAIAFVTSLIQRGKVAPGEMKEMLIQ